MHKASGTLTHSPNTSRAHLLLLAASISATMRDHWSLLISDPSGKIPASDITFSFS